MDELKKAIKELEHADKKLPREAIKFIKAHKEEAIPFLRTAIEETMKDSYEMESDYMLHFYALFLLGEFQDRDYFPELIAFVSMERDKLDDLIGDLTTSGLKEILYNTYNGDIDLLKSTVCNEKLDEYVRSALLDVMGQLYLDEKLEESDWKEFIRQRVHSGEEYSFFYDELGSIICKCHFVDMLPEIRYMFDYGLMDEMVLGEYASCVDFMFEYRDYEEDFCNTPIRTIDTLKHWAMFQDDTEMDDEYEEYEDRFFEKLMGERFGQSVSKTRQSKVGRNDPCPCGSGKKYKFCCLNKPKSPLDEIESVEERNKCLIDYPYVGNERQEGRIYLKDYYDMESIEIDKMIYLGLMHRMGPVWQRNEEKEEERCRKYLSIAFEMFVKKIEKDHIQTFTEYDKRCSIHYFCREWTGRLLELLKSDGDRKFYNEVETCFKKMGS